MWLYAYTHTHSQALLRTIRDNWLELNMSSECCHITQYISAFAVERREASQIWLVRMPLCVRAEHPRSVNAVQGTCTQRMKLTGYQATFQIKAKYLWDEEFKETYRLLR